MQKQNVVAQIYGLCGATVIDPVSYFRLVEPWLKSSRRITIAIDVVPEEIGVASLIGSGLPRGRHGKRTLPSQSFGDFCAELAEAQPLSVITTPVIVDAMKSIQPEYGHQT